MDNQPLRLLAVRLPEAERRRIKSLAASQGLTLQEAVRQALDAWMSKLQAEGALSFAPIADAIGGSISQKPKRRERAKRT
jgi:hypothetical protein